MKVKAIAIALLLMLLATWIYGIELLMRTKYATESTSIANDIVIIYYVVCALSIALASYILYKKYFGKFYSLFALIIAIIPAVTFSYLHLAGYVGLYVGKTNF